MLLKTWIAYAKYCKYVFETEGQPWAQMGKTYIIWFAVISQADASPSKA